MRSKPPVGSFSFTRTFEPETIEHAVVSSDIHAAIRDRKSAEVVPGLDLISTRIKFLAGKSIERVEHRARGVLDAQRAEIGKAAIFISLTRVLSAAISEDDAI